METTSVDIDEVRAFIEDCSGAYPKSLDTDIFDEMGVVGDDFHEMIEKYAEKYEVDMSEYLWYFHADEEGLNLGGVFIDPPYARVKRIPVTPKMLAGFIKMKKWEIDYPAHKTTTSRPDLTLGKAIISIFFLGLAIWWIVWFF